MYGLVFSDPSGNRVHEVALVDRPLTVGRAADVDVALPFKAVSRYHARFFSDGIALWVEDLGSSNGVLVSGVRIAGPTPLEPGHHVRIGVIDVIVAPAGGSHDSAPFVEEVPTDPSLPPPGVVGPGYPPQGGWPHPGAVGPTHEGHEPPPPFSDPSGPYPVETSDFGTPEAEPETSPEAPTVALPVSPRMIGLDGYLKDRVVLLDGPELTVGRVKGASLVVEDASVSRSHAKVIRKDEGFVLYDLRSFNGTFVNDERITRAELKDGDRVRFGDISFQFLLHDEGPTVRGGARRRRATSSRRRRLVLLASAVVLLAAVVLGANIIRRGEPPPPPPDPLAEERALAAKVRQQLERGAVELRRRDWDAATETLQEVLKLDPLNDDAVRGLERARVEKEVKGWLEEGVRVAEGGRDLERAKVLFAKVPGESTYYADSRLRLRQINRTIAEESRNLGLSYCRAWRYEECQQQLCRFFQSWPAGEPIPDEVRVRRALEQAESKLARRQRSEFRPCEIPEPGTGDPEADRALAKRYPDERVRGAVVAYYQGRADDGLRSLAALEKRREYREQSETIGRLIESMIRVKSSSADVHRDVRAGALEPGERTFEAMRRADAKVIPAELTSRYVREAQKLFGDAYHAIGEGHVRANRLREAFQAWSKGKSLAPTHPATLQSLLVLESRAREACQAARERSLEGDPTGAASHFELCRDITPPTNPLHQGAVEGLRQLRR